MLRKISGTILGVDENMLDCGFGAIFGRVIDSSFALRIQV